MLQLPTQSWPRLRHACLATACTLASCATSEPESDGEFLIVAAGALPEFEGSGDVRPVPFVVSRFTAGRFRVEVEGLQARVDALADPTVRGGLALSTTIPRNDDVDAAAVAALPELDAALEAGAFIGFRTPLGLADEDNLTGRISARHDVTGVHDGLLVTSELEYFFAANYMLRFGIGVNATYADDDYMRTYFDVTAGGASASGLPPFEAGGGLKDVGAELLSIVSFSQSTGLFARAGYNRLLGNAHDSPIVSDAGSPDQLFLALGVFLNF